MARQYYGPYALIVGRRWVIFQPLADPEDPSGKPMFSLRPQLVEQLVAERGMLRFEKGRLVWDGRSWQPPEGESASHATAWLRRRNEA